MWSHSARCSNYLYVQMQSQTVLTTKLAGLKEEDLQFKVQMEI